MSNVQLLTVDAEDDGARLDRWFKRHFPALAHGRLRKLLRTGQVRLDGRRAKANDRLEQGQQVRIPPLNFSAARPGRAGPQRTPDMSGLAADLRGRILYQDDDILAIDKPAGLAVQGGSKTSRHIDAALDGLRLGAKDRPRLVHRLDRDTSGVLLLARSVGAARWLTAAFQRRQTRKLYWALVAGAPLRDQGLIDMPLGKLGGRNGEKMAASPLGKRAQTVYRIVDRAGRKASWLAMEPLTGRTHQLRAHAALALETPIIGDGKYGGKEAFPDGLPDAGNTQLHARAIRLASPGRRRILIEAPPPSSMKANFDFLGFNERDENAGLLEEDE